MNDNGKLIINKGEIVIFPTDTVYGVGCLLYDIEAIDKIYLLKEREKIKELPVLVSSIKEAKELGIFNEKALKLANHFWPGALTIIVKSSLEHFNKSGKETIGIRMPNNEMALNILKSNGPLKTTSVNKSGLPPLFAKSEIIKEYQNKVDKMYFEEKETYLNLSSTTIDLTNNNVKFIRIGSIKEEEIWEVINNE